MVDGWQGLKAHCEPMGSLEYVVESRHHGELETWLVLRPYAGSTQGGESPGVSLRPGCRLVVEAQSLRPVGVLEPDLPPAPMPAGYNPYFDLPPA
jgi:hypothetical protein